MVTGIEHVGINAKDTEALKNWYVDFFGCTIAYDNKKTPPTYFVKFASDDMIEIYPGDEEGNINGYSNKANGIRHIALGISLADFDAMVAKIEASGLPIVTPAAKTDAGIGTIFFRDPEGNILHLIARAKPLV